MFVIGVRDKPMKMAKKIDGFSATFALNIEYEENVKRGVLPLMGVHAIWGFSDSAHTSGG